VKCHTAINQRDELQHIRRVQLQLQHDNGGTRPSKKTIFTPLSILFRPHQKPAFLIFEAAGFWWRRRVPPPGPIGLLHRSFIAIADPRTGKADIVFS